MKFKKAVADKLKYLRSGSVEVRHNDNKSVVMTVKKSSINVNFVGSLPFKISKGEAGIMTKLSEAKDFAEKLRDEKVTLYLLRKDKLVMKLGKDANPKFSRLVTRSKAVEIANLKELRRLDKELGSEGDDNDKESEGE